MDKKSLKEFIKKNWNYFIAIFFFFWWIFDLSLKINIYGSHEYLWFCSFSLLILSIAFFLKNSTLLSIFLAVALVFQSLWCLFFFVYIINPNFLPIGLQGVFGIGISFQDYLDSLRHLFMIPLAFFGLKKFGNPTRSTPLLTALFVSLMAWGSYFISSPFENLNCSIRSCYTLNSSIGLFEYTFPFFITVLIACAFILNPLINWFIRKSHENKKFMKFLNLIILSLFIIATFGSIFGYLEYSKVPHYLCENKDPNVFCKGAYKVSDNSFLLVYYLRNQTATICNISVYSSQGLLNTEVQATKPLWRIYLEPPKEDTYVYLNTTCSNV